MRILPAIRLSKLRTDFNVIQAGPFILPAKNRIATAPNILDTVVGIATPATPILRS